LTARPVVDLHCDTLLHLWEQGERFEASSGAVDLPRLLSSPVGIQVFAVFVEPRYGEDRGLRVALALVERFWQEVEAHGDHLFPILTREDLKRVQAGRVGGLLLLEGGDVLGDTPDLLTVLFRLGVRGLTLTWNGRNRLGDGALDQGSRGGLSALGRAVVQRAEALGMLVDVSHAADALFWSVLETTRGPVVASHSDARALTPHPRNVTDDMVAAIARRGGVVGVNFHHEFLAEGGEATVDDVFRHLEHLLAVGGEEAVAFGSDFDGIPKPPRGLEDVRGFSLLLEAMARRGWSDETIERVAGGNARRVLASVLPPEGGVGRALQG
jgi:membrane dipeptidase